MYKDDGLECEMCLKWFHAVCQGVTAELYAVLTKYNSQMWFCNKCKPSVKKNSEKIRELEKQNEIMQAKLGILEENWEKLRKELMDETISKVRTELGEELIKTTTKHVMEQIKEENEKEKKKENIIMYNVKESRKERPEERIKDDSDLVSDIIEHSLETTDYNIEQVIRLGKAENGRTRPLLVKLRTEKQKWNVIKNAKKLKNATNDDRKKIGIALDMTEKERELEKKLRAELKRRRDNGETGLYIKNGKLIKAREDY